jgi:hypothetical protein
MLCLVSPSSCQCIYLSRLPSNLEIAWQSSRGWLPHAAAIARPLRRCCPPHRHRSLQPRGRRPCGGGMPNGPGPDDAAARQPPRRRTGAVRRPHRGWARPAPTPPARARAGPRVTGRRARPRGPGPGAPPMPPPWGGRRPAAAAAGAAGPAGSRSPSRPRRPRRRRRWGWGLRRGLLRRDSGARMRGGLGRSVAGGDRGCL